MNDTVIAIIAGAAIFILAIVLIRVCKKRRCAASQGGDGVENAQVYVGNLSYRVHERDLRQCFEKYGTIAHLKVVKDRDTGRSKGFGFVTFETFDQAKKALVVHGEPLFGRNLVVRLAKPR